MVENCQIFHLSYPIKLKLPIAKEKTSKMLALQLTKEKREKLSF